MRIAFISDVHGHFQALQAVLADIEKSHVQSVVCLGDVISLGLQPREVIELLQQTECRFIMGNHDEPFVDYAKMAMLTVVAEDIYTLNKWTAGQVSEEDLAFVATFKDRIEIVDECGRRVLCFHGTPRCNHQGISPGTREDDVAAFLDGCAATVFVGGHTHQQMIREWSGRLIVNPGSVGYVFNDQLTKRQPPLLRPWAEYGILDLSRAGLAFELKKVPFDIEAVRAVVATTDIPYRDWWVRQYA